MPASGPAARERRGRLGEEQLAHAAQPHLEARQEPNANNYLRNLLTSFNGSPHYPTMKPHFPLISARQLLFYIVLTTKLHFYRILKSSTIPIFFSTIRVEISHRGSAIRVIYTGAGALCNE